MRTGIIQFVKGLNRTESWSKEEFALSAWSGTSIFSSSQSSKVPINFIYEMYGRNQQSHIHQYAKHPSTLNLSLGLDLPNRDYISQHSLQLVWPCDWILANGIWEVHTNPSPRTPPCSFSFHLVKMEQIAGWPWKLCMENESASHGLRLEERYPLHLFTYLLLTHREKWTTLVKNHRYFIVYLLQ